MQCKDIGHFDEDPASMGIRNRLKQNHNHTKKETVKGKTMLSL
jgi:hypothetical protein